MDVHNGAERASTWGQFWTSVVGVVLVIFVIDFTFGRVMDALYARSSNNPVANIEHAKSPWISVGSSIAKYAIDPSVMKIPVYNAGQNGQGIYYVAALLASLPEDTAVKKVIWFFDPADLVETIGEGNTQNLRAITPLTKWNPQLRQWIAAGDLLKSWGLYANLYRYRLLAPGILISAIRPHWSATGYSPIPFQDVRQNDDVQKTKIVPRTTPIEGLVKRLAISADGRKALHVLAQEVEKRGMDLVVVTPAIYQDDRVANPVYENMYSEMRKALLGPRVCDLTDVRGSSLRSMSSMRNLYSDGAHFNHEGAQYFSRHLDVLILKSCFTMSSQ